VGFLVEYYHRVVPSCWVVLFVGAHNGAGECWWVLVGAGVLSEMVVSGGCRGKVAYAYHVVDGLPRRSPQSPIRLIPVNLSYNCFKRPYGWSFESQGRCGQGKTGVGEGWQHMSKSVRKHGGKKRT
jgi:hypothetical protein